MNEARPPSGDTSTTHASTATTTTAGAPSALDPGTDALAESVAESAIAAIMAAEAIASQAAAEVTAQAAATAEAAMLVAWAAADTATAKAREVALRAEQAAVAASEEGERQQQLATMRARALRKPALGPVTAAADAAAVSAALAVHQATAEAAAVAAEKVARLVESVAAEVARAVDAAAAEVARAVGTAASLVASATVDDAAWVHAQLTHSAQPVDAAGADDHLAHAGAAAGSPAAHGDDTPDRARAVPRERATAWASILADSTVAPLPEDDGITGPVTVGTGGADVGLWQDISLAARMTVALRVSEASFESAFDSAPVAMLMIQLTNDRPAPFLHANTALAALTGYSVEDLSNLNFTHLERGHEQPFVLQADDEPPTTVTRHWVHADGRDLRVRLHMAAVPSSGDQLARMVCTVEDVTGLARSEFMRRSSEERFRMSFDRSPHPAIIFDLRDGSRGQVSAVNRAACRLLGRSELEIRWSHRVILASVDDQDGERNLLDRLASGQLSFGSGTYGYTDAEGTHATLTLDVEPLPGQDGAPAYALASLHDRAARADTEPMVRGG